LQGGIFKTGADLEKFQTTSFPSLGGPMISNLMPAMQAIVDCLQRHSIVGMVRARKQTIHQG
jgi:hypothetical protein